MYVRKVFWLFFILTLTRSLVARVTPDTKNTEGSPRNELKAQKTPVKNLKNESLHTAPNKRPSNSLSQNSPEKLSLPSVDLKKDLPPQEDAFSVPVLAPVDPTIPHSGFVAFLGPMFFSEELEFEPLDESIANFKLNSSVRGFNAGLLLGKQFENFNLGMNMGLLGGYNRITNSSDAPLVFSSSGLVLGAILKPHTLFRIRRKMEVGPVLPLILRYASFGSTLDGIITSSRLKFLYGAGVRVAIDWGRTRFNTDVTFRENQKKYLSIEFQFEL